MPGAAYQTFPGSLASSSISLRRKIFTGPLLKATFRFPAGARNMAVWMTGAGGNGGAGHSSSGDAGSGGSGAETLFISWPDRYRNQVFVFDVGGPGAGVTSFGSTGGSTIIYPAYPDTTNNTITAFGGLGGNYGNNAGVGNVGNAGSPNASVGGFYGTSTTTSNAVCGGSGGTSGVAANSGTLMLVGLSANNGFNPQLLPDVDLQRLAAFPAIPYVYVFGGGGGGFGGGTATAGTAAKAILFGKYVSGVCTPGSPAQAAGGGGNSGSGAGGGTPWGVGGIGSATTVVGNAPANPQAWGAAGSGGGAAANGGLGNPGVVIFEWEDA